MFEIVFASCIFIGWVVSVCTHEFGHALIAYWGGDTSVKDKGYLTFNPLKYTDIQLSLVLPLLFLLLGGIPLPGGAVYINQNQLRNRGWQSAVAAAGPLATLLFAAGLSLVLYQIPDGLEILSRQNLQQLFLFENANDLKAALQDHWLAYSLIFLIMLEMAALVLNLLPIPPLDGYGIVQPWLPQSWQQRLRAFSRYGFLLVFGAFWLIPAVGRFFWAVVFVLTALLFQFPADSLFGTFLVTYQVFQAGSRPLLVLCIVVAVIITQIHKRKSSSRPQSPRRRLAPQSPQVHLAALDAALATVQANPAFSQHSGPVPAENSAPSTTPSATPPLTTDRSELLFRRAMVLLRLGQPDAALEALQDSLGANPSQGKVWYELGRLQAQRHQPIAALAAFQEVVELEPTFAAAYYEMGKIQLELDQLQAALQSFQALERLLPRLTVASYLQGVVLGHLHQWEAALTAFDRALGLNPHWADSWLDRGFVLMRLGQYEAAILALDRGLDLDPDRILAYYHQACCRSQRGEVDRALELLQIALAGDDPTAVGPDSLHSRALSDPLLAPLRSHPNFPPPTA